MTEPDADASLIDRLYAGGADDDLEDLRIVRGLVARVRDEMPGVEPSSSISAQLIQAATPAKPGFWDRLRTWFGGIAMHPGLAAAATLVIVAGAAAIWMRQGGKAATPTVSSAPPTEVAERGATLDQDKLEERVAPVDVQRETVESTSALHVDQDVRPADKPPTPKKTGSKPAAPGRDVDKVVVTGDSEGGAEGKGGDESVPDVADQTKTPTVKTEVGRTKEVVPPADEKPTSTAPPPPPSDDPGTSSKPTSDAEDDEPNGAPDDAQMARQLTRQATTAAKKGDCKTVDYLAKKVRGLDLAFYNSGFVPQPDIAACRAAKK